MVSGVLSGMTAPGNSGAPENLKIYVAGHRGLVGSAIMRNLVARGVGSDRLIGRTHAELDLTDQPRVSAFLEAQKPAHVYVAAARVGGILANDTFPADFIRDNLAVQSSVIHS